MKNELIKIVNQEKVKVPRCNWKNYSLETNAFIDEITLKPNRFNELTTLLTKRIQKYQQTDMSMIPVMLPSKAGETTNEYLDRIYIKSGYCFI